MTQLNTQEQHGYKIHIQNHEEDVIFNQDSDLIMPTPNEQEVIVGGHSMASFAANDGLVNPG